MASENEVSFTDVWQNYPIVNPDVSDETSEESSESSESDESQSETEAETEDRSRINKRAGVNLRLYIMEREVMEQSGQRRKKRAVKKKKKHSVVLNIALIAAVICFVGSAGYLIRYYYTNFKAEANIDQLEEMIVQNDTRLPLRLLKTEESEQSIQNMMSLRAQNDDLIGWVSVDGTPLSYPVMYTPEDGQYYLHRNFEKEYEYSGLPFVDERCSIRPASQNIIIYGHNMSSQTMFSTL